ncbi:unnamed protein product, partial [Effrenium voratum]
DMAQGYYVECEDGCFVRAAAVVVTVSEQIAEEAVQRLEEEEFLQTKTIPLDTIRGELELWKEAIAEEYASLTAETQAIKPLSAAEAEELMKHAEVEVATGKGVFTRKAGSGRRKVRAVVCGNQLSGKETKEEVFAGGADSIALRATLRKAAFEQWKVGTVDVKTAFLQAPNQRQKLLVVTPPKIFGQAGVTKEGERWLVLKALYGLNTSPKDWGCHRDKTMASFGWRVNDVDFKIYPLEGNLWAIREVESGATVGNIVVYVDDMLVAAKEGVMKGFMQRLQQEWKTSAPEVVEGGTPVTFCGMEICEKEGGFWLGQSAYIRDLVGRYPEVKNFDVPAVKVELAEEEEVDRTADDVREAQVALGELLWVSTRTRPDVAFAVGQASRMVARNPKQALQAAKQILGYLKGTDEVGIIYRKEMKPREGEVEFPGPQHMGTLEIQADVSFAPGGGRSIQGVMVMYGGMGLDVLEGKKVKKVLGSKPNGTFGAAGWLVVDKLKAVIGMLSLAAGAMAEEVVEIDEESIPVELILTVVAVLAVVVWEITKKDYRQSKRPGTRGGRDGRWDLAWDGSVLGTERMEYYRKMEQLSEDRWAFLEARNRGRYGMKEDGTLGPGELVRERKKEKLAMGKKSKMAYNMVRWCQCKDRAAVAGLIELRGAASSSSRGGRCAGEDK